MSEKIDLEQIETMLKVDENGLLPCPLCGNKAEMVRIFGRIGVSCSECNVCIRSSEIDSEYGYDIVIKEWNTRLNIVYELLGEVKANNKKIEKLKDQHDFLVTNNQVFHENYVKAKDEARNLTKQRDELAEKCRGLEEDCNKYECSILKRAKKAESQLEAQQWIKINSDDDLPKENVEILFQERKNIHKGRWMKPQNYGRLVFCNDSGTWYEKKVVTDWMPITPPKENKEDDTSNAD